MLFVWFLSKEYEFPRQRSRKESSGERDTERGTSMMPAQARRIREVSSQGRFHVGPSAGAMPGDAVVASVFFHSTGRWNDGLPVSQGCRLPPQRKERRGDKCVTWD